MNGLIHFGLQTIVIVVVDIVGKVTVVAVVVLVLSVFLQKCFSVFQDRW